jgi:hypothetical protein
MWSLFDIRRRRTRVLCVLGAGALLLTAAPSAVANLSGSSFEGSDGNFVVNTSGNYDWVNAPNRVRGDDLPSGKSDNSFGQGTKEDDANVNVVTGSIPPQKSDLTRFYVANELANGANYLYLAWERSNVLGSANMDFEINKASTQPDLTVKGPATLNRTEGDLLVTFDFGGSGAPVLGLLKWVTSGSTSQCFSANALPCWGNRVDLSAAGEAEGAVNTASVTDSVAGVTLPGGTFGEAAINLTAAGVLPAGSCDGFASVFLKSRSSASFPAEVKDFVAPQPVNISNCVQPTATTAQSWVPNDSITISASGGGNLAGKAHFALYQSTDCTGTAIYDSSSSTPADVAVSGASPQTVSSNNSTAVTAGGDYSWSVSYDSTNALQKDIAATCTEVSSLTIDNDTTD